MELRLCSCVCLFWRLIILKFLAPLSGTLTFKDGSLILEQTLADLDIIRSSRNIFETLIEMSNENIGLSSELKQIIDQSYDLYKHASEIIVSQVDFF